VAEALGHDAAPGEPVKEGGVGRRATNASHAGASLSVSGRMAMEAGWSARAEARVA